MLYFYEEPYYIGIPSGNLSDHEIYLLKTLLNQEYPPSFGPDAQFWYDLLINGKQADEDRSIRIRIIHFQLTNSLSHEMIFEWRRAFESFFDADSSFIYLSSMRGIIIEKSMTITGNMLESIANTLENDFSTNCRFLIGLRYSLSPMLYPAYQKECVLFDRKMVRSKKATSVQSEFFDLIKPMVQDCTILMEIKHIIREDARWLSLIRVLWKNQGNVSIAAKKLFMHRNTLRYHIDKFYEITGISLKEMDGLTLAYLSTL